MTFPDSVVKHLIRKQSDHAPLVEKFSDNHGGHKGCFKFQQMWIKHHSFLEVVQQKCWDEPIHGDVHSKFANKLKRLKQVLISWNKEAFGNIFNSKYFQGKKSVTSCGGACGV